jgi:hypothetical protein
VPLLALTDTAVGALLGLIGVVVTTVGVVLVALITRSTKAEAKQASSGVTELAQALARAEQRIEAVEAREDHCLDALDGAWNRIAALETAGGLPPTPRPPGLNRRHRNRP